MCIYFRAKRSYATANLNKRKIKQEDTTSECSCTSTLRKERKNTEYIAKARVIFNVLTHRKISVDSFSCCVRSENEDYDISRFSD